ncbi:pentatricopeptide repeat-containing protein At5g46460, mitochondrial-like [Wolffia australiana]
MKPSSCKNPSSWSSVLLRLVRNNKITEAQQALKRITPQPDPQHFTIVLTALSRTGNLSKTLQLFKEIPNPDIVAWNSIVKGCLNCNDLPLALRFFHQIPQKNVISWTTMLDGLARHGFIKQAHELFEEMPHRDIAAFNSMISGFFSNGRPLEARSLFDQMPSRNVITWTAMIGGLDQNKESKAALDLFQRMHFSGEKPTSSTFASVLAACSRVPDAEFGTQVQSLAVKFNYQHDCFVCSSLITFYSACGLVDDAQRAFSESLHKSLVVWTALLSGYSSNCRHSEALSLLKMMIMAGVSPNQSTLTSALNSCCRFEGLEEGKAIHGGTVKAGLDFDIFVGNSLIAVYSKCGEMDDAKKNGRGRSAIGVFRDMEAALVSPDEITYVGLLAACSHLRNFEEGRILFRKLREDKSLRPSIEHYVCMVDLLCKTGRFGEVEEFIRSMSLQPNAAVWLALLSSCGWAEMEIAERAAHVIFDLDPQNSAAYVLLSNLYASAGKWDKVMETRTAMVRSGVEKNPGFSWIGLKRER